MNLFDQLLTALNRYEVHHFDHAITFITELLTEVVTEHISHFTGLSYVLNLYEILEETIEGFLIGEAHFEDFETALHRLEDMFAGVEVVEETDGEHDDKRIVQDPLPPDIIDDGLANDFITEATDGLDLVEQNLLTLETDPSHHELIDQVFRVMHTLKGTAGFLGMPYIGKIAHRTEDILGQIRDNKRVLGKLEIELLFVSVDTLKNLVNQIKDLVADEEPTAVDIHQFYVKLGECEAQGEVETPPKNPPPMPLAQQPTSASTIIPMPEPSKEFPKPDVYEARSESTNPPVKEPPKVSVTPTAKVEKSASPKTAEPDESEENGSSDREERSTSGKAKKAKFTEMLKVPADKLDELSSLVGEMVVALSLLSQNPTVAELVDRSVHKQLDHLEKTTEALRDKVLGIRMFPIGNVFGKLSRQVRDLSQKMNKTINLRITGADTLVDKSIIDNIYAPLIHLVRNSIDHGLESKSDRMAAGKSAEGSVSLDALHMGDSIMIRIEDDGRGLDRDRILAKAIERGLAKEKEHYGDKEVFNFIFQPGFSTAQKITDVSGRGVGLDVVKKTVEALRGKITIDSTPGKGTRFVLKLPLTTSIIEGLVVRVGSTRFILPILDVNLTITPSLADLKGAQGKKNEFFLLAGDLVPIVRIYQLYELETTIQDPSQGVIVVVNDGHKKYGLLVDELLHRQQIVIQNMGSRFEKLQGISGGTILGDGRVGLILDPITLIHNLHLKIEKSESN